MSLMTADDAPFPGDEFREDVPSTPAEMPLEQLESSRTDDVDAARTVRSPTPAKSRVPRHPAYQKRVTAPRWESNGASETNTRRQVSPEQKKKEREIQLLWIAYKTTGNEEARARLAELYQPLVKLLAERMAARLHSSVTVDELCSSGNLGLMDAIDGFDPSKGVKFETYCTQRVQGAMLDDLRQMDWAPRHVRYSQAVYEGAYAVLEASLGRAPSDIEMMRQLEMNCAEYRELEKKAQAATMTSLSQVAGAGSGGADDDDESMTRLELLANEHSPSPTMHLSESDALRTVLSTLSSKERIIFVLYHCEQLTMRQIGEIHGVSESRVSQIHTDVLKRLQDLIEERGTDLLG